MIRVQGWHDYEVIWCDYDEFGNSVAGHVIRVKGSLLALSLGYLRQGSWSILLPIPFYHVSLHPYTMFVASGFQSPTLAKA